MEVKVHYCIGTRVKCESVARGGRVSAALHLCCSTTGQGPVLPVVWWKQGPSLLRWPRERSPMPEYNHWLSGHEIHRRVTISGTWAVQLLLLAFPR